jgi:hypothetical protein
MRGTPIEQHLQLYLVRVFEIPFSLALEKVFFKLPFANLQLMEYLQKQYEENKLNKIVEILQRGKPLPVSEVEQHL